MTPLDWVIVAILAVSVILAVEQGLVFELLSLAGVVVGYLAAAWGYRQLSPRFLPYVKSAPLAELAGFLTIFFVVLLLAGIAGRLARWSVKQAGLHWFDRVLGGVFGLVRGVVIVAVLVLGIAALSPNSRALQESRLAKRFLGVARGASWLAPAALRQRFGESLERWRSAPANLQPPAADGAPQHQPAPAPKERFP